VATMRKVRKSFSPTLSVKLPPMKIKDKFLIIYELEGCQKAVDYLTKYYKVKRMKIVLDGKRVGKSCLAWYLENKACFKKKGLNKQVVLHEFYHHLIDSSGLEITTRKEENEANCFARCFIKKAE
jgi:hypothetical protein